MRRRGVQKFHIALAAFSSLVALVLAWPVFTYWREQGRGQAVVELRRLDVNELPKYEPPPTLGSSAAPPTPPAPTLPIPDPAVGTTSYPPMSESHAIKLFTIDEFSTYDPYCGSRHNSHLDLHRSWMEHPDGAWRLKTNSLGMREDREPSGVHPKLRILVTGDSHTDGVCNNAESFPHVLEDLLTASRLAAGSQKDPSAPEVEVLNTGKGGYSFFNYLGVLERYRYLEPQVFVVAVYGGNDFLEAVTVYNYYHRLPQPQTASRYWPLVVKAMKINQPALAQTFNSLKFFQTDPTQKSVALTAAKETTQQMKAECERRHVRMIVVYIPPVSDVSPAARSLHFQKLCQVLELNADTIKSTDELADAYLSELRDLGIEALDLRPAFRESKEALYWATDLHINLAAHRLIARELAKLF
jgi:GDSL-like lipase/acylhydrolase family protein